jgi:excisionase family DNA binding protein
MSMLGLKEAANLAGVSRDTLRRAIQRGELPALLVTGKTGPQFEVDQADVEVWVQKRATVYPQWEDEQATQAQQDLLEDAQVQVQSEAGGTSELSLRLSSLEDSHRDQSLALVRLAIQQDLLQSVQRWKERAGSSKAKVRKLRKQLAEVAELAEENRRRQELWEAEKEQLMAEIRTRQERVNWLEKRVPRWVRGLFGAK